jgi:hypothetical protein
VPSEHPTVRAIEILALRRMTPEERLRQAFDLTDRVRRMAREALARRYPDDDEAGLRARFLRRLEQCRNQNW